MKSRAATIGLLLALCACSQQDQASGPDLGAPGMHATAALSASPASASRGFDAIANSPDRGALINYDRRTAPVKQGAFTSHRVEVSEEHAIRAIVTGKLSIPSPSGEYLQLRYERHAESNNGNWTWVGRLAGGDQSQEAIITFGEKAVFGSIPQSGGRPALSLTTRSGKLWVVETDPRLAPAVDRREQDTIVRVGDAGRQLAAAASPGARVTAASTASATTSSSNTIDVLLGYTTGFAARFGGQSQAVTRLTHLVDINNQAFSNSQINGAVRLVGTQQVDYTDGGTNRSALIDLTGSDGSRATTVPASLQPLRAARETLGADLVALVRAYEYVNEGCGIAWLLGAGQQQIVPGEDSPFGYAIVANLPDNASVVGTDGKNYFCARETVAHELGHLMGSAHDIENSKNDDGVVRYGRYSYSFGAKTDPTAGNYYTIMSYGEDKQTSYRVFSNPNVTLCGGLACGVVNQADNARSLNQTIPVVVNFRARVVLDRSRVRNDMNNDGRSDVLWYNSSTNQHGYWLMNGSAIVGSRFFSASAGYRMIVSGDFDGDGYGDEIWIGSARDTFLLSGSAAGTFTAQSLGTWGQGWNVTGSGDINGDGRDDIAWHNPAINQHGYWLMNGASVIGSRFFAAGAGFSLATVGDYNGDGLLDQLWVNASRQMFLLTGNGTDFTSRSLGAGAAGWQAVGSGDVNGDGRSDILWHNASSNQHGYWLMGPMSEVVDSKFFNASSGYRVASVGDFNGDGLVDEIWSSDARDLWLLTSTGSGFSSQSLGVGGAGWAALYPTR